MSNNIGDLIYGHTILKNQVSNKIFEIKKQVKKYFEYEEKYKHLYAENCTHAESESGYRNLQSKEQFMIRSLNLPTEILSSILLAEQLHALGVCCLKKLAMRFGWDWSYISSLIEPCAFFKDGLNDSVFWLIKYIPTKNASGIDTAAHQDLGLLTFVLPTGVPALEIYDFITNHGWINIEDQQGPADVIVMAGESLSLISNQKIVPATHRIRCVNTPRISMSYQMRFKSEAIIDSSRLTTEKTEAFSKPFCMTGADFLKSERKHRKSVNGSY